MKVIVPYQVDPRKFLEEQIRQVVLLVVPVLVLMLLAYFTWPAARKAIVHTRRRSWARRQGVRERVAVAYAEWRDLATDFGYRFLSDTPLMFLGRVTLDEEHTEFAWLVTRALWGDLQDKLRVEEAVAAEELSRSLRKRMAQPHAWTLRLIAAVSRLSLRYPYAPHLGAVAKQRPRKEKKVEAAAA